MQQNPEEGRLTPEAQAEQLRLSRKYTTQMKRQYRQMRREAEAKAGAERWASNHRRKHQEAYDELATLATKTVLNRAGRRHFAKLMNVFKSPDGWKHFMANYTKSFGTKETVVKVKSQTKEPKSNIQQALENAQVIAKEEQ